MFYEVILRTIWEEKLDWIEEGLSSRRRIGEENPHPLLVTTTVTINVFYSLESQGRITIVLGMYVIFGHVRD